MLENSNIIFAGDNSVVFLSSSRRSYKMKIVLRHDSVFFSGSDNYFNEPLEVILSEQKNVFIGNAGLYSRNICFRVADPHIIYNCETRKRVNLSKSIYIGDHVWIGENALILKGTQVGSGSIIGGGSVVSGKKIPSNTSWGGNPARKIAEGVFFTNAVVHLYRETETEKSMFYNSDEFVYEKDIYSMEFDGIEEKLKNLKASQDKLEFLQLIQSKQYKNRFYL